MNRPMCSFEDWWIDSKEFDDSLIQKIKSNELYPSDIINKFKQN